MVRVVIAGFMLLILFACGQSSKNNPAKKDSIQSGTVEFVFQEEFHNFGKLKAGEVVAYTFVFKNTGTCTLLVTDVDPGCGCIEVNIAEKQIEPGDQGQIEIVYNSAGEVGKNVKPVTITFNGGREKVNLVIQAEVENEMIKLYS